MPSEPQRLDWESVSVAAGKAFSIWVGQPELRWAKGAWDHLERAGLTMFTSELGRCRVALRLPALAGIYHDFRAMAWEERQEPEYSEWASELEGLTPFRIGS